MKTVCFFMILQWHSKRTASPTLQKSSLFATKNYKASKDPHEVAKWQVQTPAAKAEGHGHNVPKKFNQLEHHVKSKTGFCQTRYPGLWKWQLPAHAHCLQPGVSGLEAPRKTTPKPMWTCKIWSNTKIKRSAKILNSWHFISFQKFHSVATKSQPNP